MTPIQALCRTPWLCVVLCLLIASSCGGGGGDDTTPGGDPVILSLYLFAMGDTASGTPFRVSFSEGGNDYTVALGFPGDGLRGVWDLSAGLYTIGLGSQLAVDSDVGTPFLGMFGVDVTADIPVVHHSPSLSGSFEVTQGAVTTVVTLNGMTVDVSIDGAPATTYAIDAFEDLFGGGASDDLQRASFAWAILQFLMDQANFLTMPLELIEDGDYQTVNPVQMNCSSYGGLIPPPGLPNPGSWSFLWADVFADGLVGSGDTFTWTFSDCWEDQPSSDSDLLWGGSIDFVNYRRVVTSGTVTRFGYEPSGSDGGVFFNNTLQTETDVQAGAVVLQQERYLNGSHTFVLWAP